MTLLVADSIGKQFGGRKVLTAASLRAERGAVAALLGRNGAGKSTLLNIAAGVIAPDHGMVMWRDRRLQRTRTWRLAREGLLLLPTDGTLSPAGRLREQLELVARTFSSGSVDSALVRMRLGDRASDRVSALSGGERRRAEIAAAIVRQPICLLADEAFLGLAPLDAELVGETLREIAAGGCAVVITGHEVPFLLRFSDRITWCTSGTTHELGDPRSAVLHDAFRAAYLGEQW